MYGCEDKEKLRPKKGRKNSEEGKAMDFRKQTSWITTYMIDSNLNAAKRQFLMETFLEFCHFFCRCLGGWFYTCRGICTADRESGSAKCVCLRGWLPLRKVDSSWKPFWSFAIFSGSTNTQIRFIFSFLSCKLPCVFPAQHSKPSQFPPTCIPVLPNDALKKKI